MSTFLKVLILMCFHYAVPARVIDADDLKVDPRQLPEASSCAACTDIFGLMKDLLVDTGVQGMTTNNLNTLCESLLGPGPDELCKQIVDKNLPMVFALADKLIKPDHFCAALGFCGDTVSELAGLMTLLQTALRSTHAVDGPEIQCQICTQLIDTIIALLPKDQLEEALITVLEQGCNLLPDLTKPLCQNFVDKVTRSVFELVTSFISPDTICSLLHLCADSSVESPIMA